MTRFAPRAHPDSARTDTSLFRWEVDVDGKRMKALACAHAPTFLDALEICRTTGEVPLLAAPHQREKTAAQASMAWRPSELDAASARRGAGVPHHATLGFLTSGSTGDARVVWKSEACLIAEARVLASRFFTRRGGVVTALVPPCHLYGFLFAGLAPALADMSVCTVEPGTPAQRVPVSHVLVAVPSLFPYVEELVRAGRVAGTLVFSGAPLGEARRAALRDLLSTQDACEAFEILGSTESGGIGLSPVANASPAFEPLPGVHLTYRQDENPPDDGLPRGGAWELRSDFLFPEGSVLTLDDRLEEAPGGTFLHLGRTDRIFKYSGRRFSLTEIESRLRSLSGASRCLCAFQEDVTHPKGGVLVAYLERPHDVAGLRRAWHATGAALHGTPPFPQDLHVLDSFPVDPLGKVTLQALNREVTHGSR